MKVIVRRSAHEIHPFRFDCKHCTSTLETTKEEGRFFSNQRDGDCYVFKCPVCGTDNWVAARVVRRETGKPA